jgi:hypothetical protein
LIYCALFRIFDTFGSKNDDFLAMGDENLMIIGTRAAVTFVERASMNPGPLPAQS